MNIESEERDAGKTESTKIEMRADKYDRDATVASDGRLWLGEDWAGEEVEIALRKKAE